MSEPGRKPIHQRGPDGRHHVDLRNLPPAAKYPIAFAVIALVLWAATVLGPDRGIDAVTIEPFVPYLAGLGVLIVALYIWLRIRLRR